MAFNFGAASGGQPAASTPAFGFGASAQPASSSAFSFGASSQPAFSGAGGGLFGSNQQSSAPSTGFGFGSGTPQPASGAGGFSFGAATSTASLGFGSTPFGASTGGGLFGAASTGANLFGGSSGLFGAASAPQPSLFGASTPAQSTPGGGLFGGQPQQGQPFGTPTAGTATDGQAAGIDPTVLSDLAAIDRAYTERADNPDYKLRALFLNTVENPAARVQPPGVDRRQFEEAVRAAGGPNNPERLWPVMAVGFRDLMTRARVQEETLKEHAARLAGMTSLTQRLRQTYETDVLQRLEAVRATNERQIFDLLQVFRHLDALEAAMGPRGGRAADGGAMHALRERLRALEASVGARTGANVHSRAEGVEIMAKSRARSMAKETGALRESEGMMDAASLKSLFEVLHEQVEVLQRLQDVVARDERDLAIIKEQSIDGAGY
ncbi:unnamed protein product [Pedinophyceae sp. YPF-701]|nr:unnamed protein product [Pedinophyceae sp. YPF-701]